MDRQYLKANGNYPLKQGLHCSDKPGSQPRGSLEGQRPNGNESLRLAEQAHDQDVALPPPTTTIWRHQSRNIKIPCLGNLDCLSTDDDHGFGRRECISPCPMELQLPLASVDSHHYPAFGTSDPWDESKPWSSRTPPILRLDRLSSHQVHLRTTGSASFGQLHEFVKLRALQFWGVQNYPLAERRLALSPISNGIAVQACDYDSLVTRQNYVLTLAMSFDDLALAHGCNLAIDYLYSEREAQHPLLTGFSEIVTGSCIQGKCHTRPCLQQAATNEAATLPYNLDATLTRPKPDSESILTGKGNETVTRRNLTVGDLCCEVLREHPIRRYVLARRTGTCTGRIPKTAGRHSLTRAHRIPTKTQGLAQRCDTLRTHHERRLATGNHCHLRLRAAPQPRRAKSHRSTLI